MLYVKMIILHMWSNLYCVEKPNSIDQW